MTRPCARLAPVPVTQEDLWTIRHSTLFGRLPEKTFQQMFEERSVHTAGKGTPLYTWGARVDVCVILLKGLVKLFRTSETGEAAVLAIHGPGRTLMLAEGLADQSCSASAETISPVRLICLDIGELRSRMQQDNLLSMALLAAAAADLRQLVAHVEELKGMTGPTRLAAMILNLSETRSGARRLTLPYEKQLIAGRLGMTPESFSRAMRQLKAHGISISRERIEITDVGQLRAFVSAST